jgi:hypothetical protein
MISRAILIGCMIAVAILQTVIPVSAGGPADNPSCVVPNPPGGATAVRGTVAVGVQNAATNGSTDVDFTLRLSRGGALAFFRVSLNMQVFAVSNEGILCHLLRDDQSTAAASTRAAILSAFGFNPNATFSLVDKSLSNAEIQGSVNQWLCDGMFTPPTPLSSPPCGTQPPRGASMADVLIYVQ